MRTKDLLRLLAGLALAVPLAACDGDEDMMPATGNAGSGGMGEAPCAVDPEDFALFQETMSKAGLYAVRIVAADPAPPQQYLNEWMVEFVEPGGDVIESATLNEVSPWMPAHGHDGQFAPTITPMEAGQFDVKRLNLWMGGGWTVTFNVTIEDQTDEAVVDVCIPD